MSEIEPVIGWPAHDRQIMSLLSETELQVSNLKAEIAFLAQEARRYASHYPEASDGRNTFILFAEMIERRNALEASI